jgi:hypothetical protein
MSDSAWLTSDALPLATLEEIAFGTYEESVPGTATEVPSFGTYAWFGGIPLVIQGYTVLRDPVTFHSQSFISSETWSASNFTLTANPLMYQIPYRAGQVMVAVTLATGATVAAFVVKEPAGGKEPMHVLLRSDIVDPNALAVPDVVPPDGTTPLGTPRFLVGVGTAAGKSVDGKTDVVLDVLHEQCWRPATTSFSLAPGEKRRIVLTQESGVSTTSSDEVQLSATLGLSVSGGWGPISASLSASFSASSQVAHSRTLTSRSISTTEVRLTNSAGVPQQVVYWELVDIYTLVEHIATPTTPTAVAGLDPVVRGAIECVAAPTVARLYPPPAVKAAG